MKLLIVLLGMLLGLAGAGVIRVPGDYTTIQAGLDAAGTGDTVLVGPGSYRENITWPERDGIRLISSSGPEATIIDGGGIDRVIDFSNRSITRETELRGFTISGGSLSTGAGAGIHIRFCSPVIAGNIIRDNEHTGERSNGAGLFINGSPLIRGNVIRDNVIRAAQWNYGAGIHIAAGTVVIDSNVIRGNQIIGDGFNYGGGIHVAGGTAEVSFNIIDSNRVTEGGWNYGAGVYIGSNGVALLWQNKLKDNVNALGDRAYGAGLYNAGQALLFSNSIYDNINDGTSWSYGGGVLSNGFTELYNNTIVNNDCRGGTVRHGGGVYVSLEDTTVAQNNIIVANSAAIGGGFFRAEDEASVLDNRHNNVWSNFGGDYHNSVPGPGDISDNPLFLNGPWGRYYLCQIAAGQDDDSPCVGAGAVLPEMPMRLDTLLAGWTTRADEVPAGRVLSMGYHHLLDGPGGIEDNPSERYRVAASLQVVPNPVRGGQATLQYSLPRAGPVRVSLFDVVGRKVLSMNLVAQQTGRIALDLRELSAGSYLVRLEADGFAGTQKLIVQ